VGLHKVNASLEYDSPSVTGFEHRTFIGISPHDVFTYSSVSVSHPCGTCAPPD